MDTFIQILNVIFCIQLTQKIKPYNGVLLM